MAATLATASECDTALAAFIRRHPRLLVLTGAGCSVASGIPEYRDHEGAVLYHGPRGCDPISPE